MSPVSSFGLSAMAVAPKEIWSKKEGRRRSTIIPLEILQPSKPWKTIIAALELMLSAVTDVQDFNLLLLFQDAVYSSINVSLVAVQQMPELFTLRRHRVAVGLLFQTENRLLEPAIPFQGRAGILGVDPHIQESEIALGTGG